MRKKSEVTKQSELIKAQYNHCEGMAHLLIAQCYQCDNLGNYFKGYTLNHVFKEIFIKKHGVHKQVGMLIDLVARQSDFDELAKRVREENGNDPNEDLHGSGPVHRDVDDQGSSEKPR